MGTLKRKLAHDYIDDYNLNLNDRMNTATRTATVLKQVFKFTVKNEIFFGKTLDDINDFIEKRYKNDDVEISLDINAKTNNLNPSYIPNNSLEWIEIGKIAKLK